MTHRTIQAALAGLVIVAAVGCKKPAPPPPPPPPPPVEPPPPPPPPPPPVREIVKNFSRVNFELDSYDLNSSTKSALDENAVILKDQTDVKIQIQGHCDERGTTGYNSALGQRRANAVQKYLLSKGVEKSRIVIISYGEERPLAQGSYESAWAENRRAEFKVTFGGEGEIKVRGTTRD
jgi:peptidoglycan-associated lipoprotein